MIKLEISIATRNAANTGISCTRGGWGIDAARQ